MSNDDKKFIANLINQVKDELGARITDVRNELSARIDGVNQRITDVRDELGARIEAVHDELNDKIDSYHNTKRSPTLKQRVSKLEKRVDEHDELFNKLKVK